MRYLPFLIGVVFILGACIVSAQDKADFSGKWVLNADESDMGGPPGGGAPPGGGEGGPPAGGRGGMMGASRLIIAQEENKLTVETVRQGFDGSEMSTVSAYTLDGKSGTNTSDFGSTTYVASWSDDGQMLTIKSSMTMSRGDQSFTMDTTEKYSLADGKLVVETTRSTPMGDMTSKAVYDKAEE
ncbi:hypothetical protein JW824_01740 [bacterium]|nr:hypothetical protein [bacterium]